MRARGHAAALRWPRSAAGWTRALIAELARTKKEGKGREMASDAHCARMVCMIAVW